jgi:hypothetical protein
VLPYWLLFTAFALAAAGTRKRISFRAWNPILVLAGLFAAAMVGLRRQVGADWENYERIYYATGYLDLFEALRNVDPAYALLNWLAYAGEIDLWIVNLICAAIFVFGLLKFANHQPNPWLCMVVAVPYLIIVVGMGYTRQAVALGFILWGLADFEHKPLSRFVLLMFCAAAFHKTAIALLPIIAMSTMRNRFIVLSTLGAVGFLLFTFFFARAMDILSAAYLEQDYDASGALIRVMMNVIPAVIFLLFTKRFEFTPTEARLWRNFSIASLAALPMLLIAASSVIVDRLAIYLIPLQLVIFSRLPWAFRDRGRPNLQVAFAVLLYAAAVQFVWINYAEHAKYWLPYKFWPVSEPSYEAEEV